MALMFKSPTPKHTFSAAEEKKAVTRHFTERKVPSSGNGRLLLATWNIANLGVQKRTEPALQIISHILQRFDLIAVQEVHGDFRTFDKVVAGMGKDFDYVMTDTAGNDERLAFVYRKPKVEPARLFGELALRPSEYPKRTVKVRWQDKSKKEQVDVFKNHRFVPFDRNPYLGSFRSGKVDFLLANVHLYFGKFQNSKSREDREKYARRVLEIFTLSKWANKELKGKVVYDKDILLLGDMNVPSMGKNESTYKVLTGYGWVPVQYETRTAGSNLGNDRTYDQMVFAPDALHGRLKGHGVFDFDNTIFRPLWEKIEKKYPPRRDGRPSQRAVGLFNRHVKHHISDHRPRWVEIDVS